MKVQRQNQEIKESPAENNQISCSYSDKEYIFKERHQDRNKTVIYEFYQNNCGANAKGNLDIQAKDISADLYALKNNLFGSIKKIPVANINVQDFTILINKKGKIFPFFI